MTVLIVTIEVIVGGTVYALVRKPTFKSEGVVQFDPDPVQPLGEGFVSDLSSRSFWSNQEYYKTQYEVIRSTALASMVVAELGLNTNAEFINNTEAEVVPEPAEISVASAANILTSRLTVAAVPDTRLARVSYVSANPDRARLIASAVLETYVWRNQEYIARSVAAAGDWLQEQLASLATELSESSNALNEFRLANSDRIFSLKLEDQADLQMASLELFAEQLAETKARIALLSADLESLREFKVSRPS